MIRKIAFSLLTVFAVIGVISCNSDSYYETSASYANVAVTSFSLNANDKILKGLDSVYFSIDLVKSEIFNADSLPCGTDISRMLVTITTSSCSKVDLIIPGNESKSDTTINYLTNSTDSIDFSNGPVTLHVVSGDATNERKYRISVNVHKTEPDSLYWNRMARRNLPSLFNVPAEQKTVEFKGQAYCLTRSGDKYCLASSANPANGDWEMVAIDFGFVPKVSTLTAADNGLYILDENGVVAFSQNGTSWVMAEQVNGAAPAEAESVHHIYGGYGAVALAVQKIDGKYHHVALHPWIEVLDEVPADCPISGTSQMVLIDTKWSDSPMAVIVGGKCVNGDITGDTWAFDGKKWAKISNTSIGAIQNAALFPYYAFSVDNKNWDVKQYPALIAMCGTKGSGALSKDVYISLNQGVNWKLADNLLQLPDYIPAMTAAQALVFNDIMHSRSANEWEEYASKPLPRWWSVETHFMSRATTEVTAWECPYIYLFGGINQNGQTYNTVWRGVINRLSFKPIV